MEEPMEWETVKVRVEDMEGGWRFKGSTIQIHDTAHNLGQGCWRFDTVDFVNGSIVHLRGLNELVKVERPAKAITITVELTPDEAKTLADVYQHVEPCYPSGKVVKRFADACAEAVRKAQVS